MKKGLLAIGLLVIAACLQSCVVVIDEDQGHSRKSQRYKAPDNTTAEIDAAGKLVLESHRRDAYKRIAERDHLGPDAQIHLVEAVFDILVLESSKEDVLLTLIKNPSFCPAGEQTILNGLDKLTLESDKRNILNAISNRKNRGDARG